MIISEIYLWGAAIVACLLVVASVALAVLDGKMLRHMFAIYGATVAQMAVVAAVVWLVYRTNAWWAYVIYFLLVLVLSVCWVLFPLKDQRKQLLGPVAVAMLTGSLLIGGCTLLCLPVSVFMTLFSVLMACLTASMLQTAQYWQRSLHDPEAQQPSQPQRAPDAQQPPLREWILPNIRTVIQPIVMVIPTLFVGMMMGHVSFLEGLLVVLLLSAVTFVADILGGVILLRLLLPKGN